MWSHQSDVLTEVYKVVGGVREYSMECQQAEYTAVSLETLSSESPNPEFLSLHSYMAFPPLNLGSAWRTGGRAKAITVRKFLRMLSSLK